MYAKHVIIAFVISLILTSGCGRAQGQNLVSSPVRALWVTRGQITTTSNIRLLVTRAKKYGFNTLFVQIRGRGEMFCDIPTEIKSSLIDQDFDPLKYLIEIAHKEHIAVHAWINMLLVWSEEKLPENKLHLLNLHPDWAIGDLNGKSILSYTYAERTAATGKMIFIDPANRDVRAYLVSLIQDVLSAYKVDGIHLDYLRYPSPLFGYDTNTCQTFYKQTGIFPKDLFVSTINNQILEYKKQWQEMRERSISSLLADIAHIKKEQYPHVILSVAVVSDYNRAVTSYSQNWKQWIQEGSVDWIVPMAYHTDRKIVKQQLIDASRAASSSSVKIIAGIGAWQLSKHDIIDRIVLVKRLHITGFSLFSYDALATKGSVLKKIKETEI